MSELILRIVSHWYDPAEQDRREQRTAQAHSNAIAVRVRAESVAQKVQRTRQSYEAAGRRLSKR